MYRRCQHAVAFTRVLAHDGSPTRLASGTVDRELTFDAGLAGKSFLLAEPAGLACTPLCITQGGEVPGVRMQAMSAGLGGVEYPHPALAARSAPAAERFDFQPEFARGIAQRRATRNLAAQAARQKTDFEIFCRHFRFHSACSAQAAGKLAETSLVHSCMYLAWVPLRSRLVRISPCSAPAPSVFTNLSVSKITLHR